MIYQPNPQFDLVLERTVDISPSEIWAAWTNPEYITQWFTPAPWTTLECEIDLRPGGIFSTLMCSPEGEKFPNIGCYLEIIPQEKLVWTDALLPDFRPAPNPFFTGVIQLTPTADGTLYTAIAIHKDEATKQQHADMGFHAGWNAALDQLITAAKNGFSL